MPAECSSHAQAQLLVELVWKGTKSSLVHGFLMHQHKTGVENCSVSTDMRFPTPHLACEPVVHLSLTGHCSDSTALRTRTATMKDERHSILRRLHQGSLYFCSHCLFPSPSLCAPGCCASPVIDGAAEAVSHPSSPAIASVHSLRERPLPPFGSSRCRDWDSAKMEKHLLSSAACNSILLEAPAIDEDAHRGCARSPFMATQLLRPGQPRLLAHVPEQPR